MAVVTPEEASLDSWRVSNPTQIANVLRQVERTEFDKETELYHYRESKFSLVVNEDSRLFSKSYLSNSVAIIDYMEGDLAVLLPRLLRAIETSNSCGLFIPTSSINKKKEARNLDKKANEILMQQVPNKVKRDALEMPYKQILPCYIYTSKTSPYRDAFAELTDD